MNFLRNKIEAKLFGGDVKRMIRKNKIPNPQTSLARLKQLGVTPTSVFDVGAYEGDFIKMCLDLWPNTTILAFEPLQEKVAFLHHRFKNNKVSLEQTLVGEVDTDNVKFYADETASSVLMSDEVNSKKDIRYLPMRKLESVIEQKGITPPCLLKIDTQGYEFEILKGCGKYLSSIQFILLELNFIEVYSNARLAHEVISYLNQHGFVIYDVCAIHRRPLDMALFQIDFLFVQKDSFLRKDKRWDINTINENIKHR